MNKYFPKTSSRLTAFGLLFIFLLGGCVPANEKSQATGNNESPNSSQDHHNSDSGHTTSIHIVMNESEESAGPLTSEAALGHVKIGDSKPQVFRLLGTPDERNLSQPGYETWNYKKRGVTISFYHESKDMPASGVVKVQIGEQSDLKTDTNIGIQSQIGDIEKAYSKVYGNPQLSSVWVNGDKKTDQNGYYPSLSFELKNNLVSGIVLSNKGMNPGPYPQKPLSLADLQIGDLRIGGDINDAVKKYGDPNEKTTAHGTGTPYWIFQQQGLAIDFGGPIWRISATSPFAGSTPRGIHVGSTAAEVSKAYPDASTGEAYTQTSTDGQYTIAFTIREGKVSEIIIAQDTVLK